MYPLLLSLSCVHSVLLQREGLWTLCSLLGPQARKYLSTNAHRRPRDGPRWCPTRPYPCIPGCTSELSSRRPRC